MYKNMIKIPKGMLSSDVAAEERRKLRDALLMDYNYYNFCRFDINLNDIKEIKDKVKKAIENDGNVSFYEQLPDDDLWLVQFAGKSVRECENIANRLILLNPKYLLQYPQFWNESYFMSLVLKCNRRALSELQFTIQEILKNITLYETDVKAFIMSVDSSGCLLVNDEWRKSREKVKNAIISCPNAFCFWDDLYYNDDEIIEIYLMHSNYIMLPYTLINNKKSVLILMFRGMLRLDCFPEYADNIDILSQLYLEAYNKGKIDFEAIPHSILANREFATDILRNDYGTYKYFSHFFDDEEIAMTAMCSYISSKHPIQLIVVPKTNENEQNCPWDYVSERIKNTSYGKFIERLLCFDSEKDHHNSHRQDFIYGVQEDEFYFFREIRNSEVRIICD